MKSILKRSASALAVCALTITPVALGGVVLSANIAMANNGNGGGNAGGNGNGGGNGNSGGSHGNSGNHGKSANARGSADTTAGQRNGGKGRGGILGLFLNNHSRSASAPGHGKSGKTDRLTTVSSSPEPAERPANHGALASELKGLNAAHANPTALANAAPNSQVGRIASYRDAVLAVDQAPEKLAAKEDELAALAESDAYSDRTTDEIEAEIAALDADATTEERQALEDELQAAEQRDALEEDIANLQHTIDNADTITSEALLAASNGRELSDAALAELHRLLDLDPPATEAVTDVEGGTTDETQVAQTD